MCVCVCVCLCALGGVAHFAVLLLVPHRDPSGDKITDRQNGPTPSSKLHASPVKISSRHPAGLPSYLYKYLGNPGSSRAPSSNHFILLSFSPRLFLPATLRYDGAMWLFRILSSAFFLTVTVSSIPLAFDVGGKTCGLAFSLSLATFYFLFSLLKVTTPDRSWLRSSLIVVINSTQWIILPILLIWSLNRFSIDADNSGGWVERTFSGKRAHDSSIQEWLFGPDGLVETVTVGNWEKLLRWSTPVFQLVEGFCSLLVIQAAGQITRWLVNRGGRSDSWMVCTCNHFFYFG